MTDTTALDGVISFERLIDATPDEAFALLTQPERLRRWMGVSAAVDLRVGGDYRLTVAPGAIACGTFTEIDPGKRIVYTWGWFGSGDPDPGGSTIVVDIEPTGDKTLVRLTHSGLTPEQATNHAIGWDHFMDRLDVAASAGAAGLDPWAAGGDELDHLLAAEASWALCDHIMLGLTPEMRDLPTPCRDYTLHDLVEHLMGSVRALGAIGGAQIPEDADALIDASSAEDWMAQAVEPALAAWRARGAEGEVPFGDGRAPATLPIGILAIEFFIHAWDFAQATGQPFTPSDALTAFVTELAEQIVQPDNRGDGKGFAEIVETTHDDAISRLMAFTGRTV